MGRKLHFSDTHWLISDTFYDHGTINGRRPVFDKMFENGNRSECFPNNARISPEKVDKRTLDNLVRKIDKIN